MTRSFRVFVLTFCSLLCITSIFGNHYHLLSVPKEADAKDIKKSYRKLALELHPDKLLQQNLTAEEIENKTDHFILVQEAYETLSDDRKRYLYDSTLSGVSVVICFQSTREMNLTSSHFSLCYYSSLFNLLVCSCLPTGEH